MMDEIEMDRTLCASCHHTRSDHFGSLDWCGVEFDAGEGNRQLCGCQSFVEAKTCYLCERRITQVPGQEFQLICEKGRPIMVCEDCYEEAEGGC